MKKRWDPIYFSPGGVTNQKILKLSEPRWRISNCNRSDRVLLSLTQPRTRVVRHFSRPNQPRTLSVRKLSRPSSHKHAELLTRGVIAASKQRICNALDTVDGRGTERGPAKSAGAAEERRQYRRTKLGDPGGRCREWGRQRGLGACILTIKCSLRR